MREKWLNYHLKKLKIQWVSCFFFLLSLNVLYWRDEINFHLSFFIFLSLKLLRWVWKNNLTCDSGSTNNSWFQIFETRSLHLWTNPKRESSIGRCDLYWSQHWWVSCFCFFGVGWYVSHHHHHLILLIFSPPHLIFSSFSFSSLKNLIKELWRGLGDQILLLKNLIWVLLLIWSEKEEEEWMNGWFDIEMMIEWRRDDLLSMYVRKRQERRKRKS